MPGSITHDPELALEDDEHVFLPAPTYRVESAKPMLTRIDERSPFADQDQRDLFLTALARTGRMYLSAQMSGTSTVTVRKHMRSDPAFQEQVEEALEAYKDTVRATIQRRVLEGDLLPMIGRVGKDRDGVVAYQRKFSDALLLAEAKRVDPEYRERSTVDMNVKAAGVLVVDQQMPAVDWQAAFGGQQVPINPLEGLPGIDANVIALSDKRQEREGESG